jgi:WD40 repeat protein
MTAPITLEPWTPLPGGAGDALAVSGRLSASASGTSVVVWDGARVVSTAPVSGSPGGVPRFVGDRLFFGPGWMEGGRWVDLPSPAPTVHGGVRASAWSRDGRRVALVVDGPWNPAGGGASSLLVERGVDGSERVVAVDPGVSAVWVLDAAIVGVGRELRVWDAGGERVVGPAHEGGVASVSASRDDAWLLTVGTDGTALLWSTQDFGPPSRWSGAWVGAALSPDGRWAVGIDVGGALHAACRRGVELVSEGAMPAVGRVRAVVLDDKRVVASFNEAPFHRTATMTAACPPGP